MRDEARRIALNLAKLRDLYWLPRASGPKI